MFFRVVRPDVFQSGWASFFSEWLGIILFSVGGPHFFQGGWALFCSECLGLFFFRVGRAFFFLLWDVFVLMWGDCVLLWGEFPFCEMILFFWVSPVRGVSFQSHFLNRIRDVQ